MWCSVNLLQNVEDADGHEKHTIFLDYYSCKIDIRWNEEATCVKIHISETKRECCILVACIPPKDDSCAYNIHSFVIL